MWRLGHCFHDLSSCAVVAQSKAIYIRKKGLRKSRGYTDRAGETNSIPVHVNLPFLFSSAKPSVSIASSTIAQVEIASNVREKPNELS